MNAVSLEPLACFPRKPVWRRKRTWIGAVALLATVAIGGIYWMLERAGIHPIPALIMPVPFVHSTIAMRTPNRLRVLFIGNSFTQFNGGQARICDQLAKSAGIVPQPVFDQVTIWGATWQKMWDKSDARLLISQGHWDYVVLQDYSTEALTNRAEMEKYGRRFAKYIRQFGAEPVFFMTWARKDQPKTQGAIAAAYEGLGKELSATVAPVGFAWQDSLKIRPDYRLHNLIDKKHPTAAGSYLAGCVFYSIFLHRNPHGLTHQISANGSTYINLSPSDATYLQGLAWQVVKQFASIATTRPTSRPAVTMKVGYSNLCRLMPSRTDGNFDDSDTNHAFLRDAATQSRPVPFARSRRQESRCV